MKPALCYLESAEAQTVLCDTFSGYIYTSRAREVLLKFTIVVYSILFISSTIGIASSSSIIVVGFPIVKVFVL